MYSYNVSLHIDPDIDAAWTEWMTDIHIPEVMATGCFTSCAFFRLIDPVSEEGPTYIVQYELPDLSTYQQYLVNHAPRLQSSTKSKFGEKYTAFRSLMERIDVRK